MNVPVIEQTEPDISEELEVFEEPKKKQSDKRDSHAETVTFQGEIASAKDLRNTDPELIKKRVNVLPPEIRKLVEEDFKGEYVAVEKIDPDKLI